MWLRNPNGRSRYGRVCADWVPYLQLGQVAFSVGWRCFVDFPPEDFLGVEAPGLPIGTAHFTNRSALRHSRPHERARRLPIGTAHFTNRSAL